MADVDFYNLGAVGLAKDVAPHQLPPEGWSELLNVRPKDGALERLLGKTQVFGTPNNAPLRAMQVSSASAKFWLLMSTTKVDVYNFSTHTDITRAVGGDYSATRANDWFGTTIGGIPVLTNGVDVPQYWSAFNPAQALQDLSNWDANHTCKVIRGFGAYLVAYNITKSGTASPHMVKWSHPANPGALPSSWDETDDTVDAGETELSDALSGPIIDALQLGGMMIIYKENSTWIQRLIGGRFIFSFDKFLVNSGILGPHCVTAARNGRFHAVLTQDDLIVHDGVEVIPVLDHRMRRTLFDNLDPSNYDESFLFHHPTKKEVWACYPTVGQSVPDRAVVWAYNEGGSRGVLYEAEVDFVSASVGEVQDTGDTWSGVTGSWADYSSKWAAAARQSVVVCDQSNTKLEELDKGLTNDGTSLVATVQRTGLGVFGQGADGAKLVDFHRRKLVNRVWITMSGGPIDVRVGSQQEVEGNVTWSDAISFDPSTDKFVDIVAEGVAVAIEFSSSTDVEWRINSYTLVVVDRGRH